jgi:hypothetical protein
MKNDLTQARKLIKNCLETQSTYLDLGNCGIKNLGDLPELFECKHLETLILSNKRYDLEQKKIIASKNNGLLNNIEFLTKGIVNLKKLRSIKIGGDVFFQRWKTEDIEFLKSLTQLNSLDLNSNKVSDISFLKGLKQLSSLNLRSNLIFDFSILKDFSSLISLDLGDNPNPDTSFLKDLTELNSLDLSDNQISDISFLKDLTELNSLDLRSNQISELPIWITEFDMEITLDQYSSGLNLYNNPLKSPPPEIVKQGKEAIRNYFKEIKKQGVSHLYEAKMLIVGEGGAGKTSLAVRLQNRDAELPKEEDTTKGIEIQQLIFPIEGDKEFTINIWDFGGQEIYHATHQFFLTKRSLYILVDDTRKSDKSLDDAAFKHWLQTVELFGGNSPLLIVQNEKGNRSKDIDLKSMQGQFGFIKEKHQTNLLTNKGLDGLERDIKHYIQKLPHIGQELPAKWVEIRKDLVKLSKNKSHISLGKYYEVCSKHTITENKRALSLSRYLHDLGTFLHFQDDPLLKNTIFLQNKWVTDAIYKLLDHEPVKENKGHFTLEDVKEIWTNSYEDMHHQLLSLMLNFELCYKIPNTNGEYLIPQLLPESQPDDIKWDNKNNLQLRYKYGFMPKGLLSRLIVRKHNLLKNIANAWKKGVVLEKRDTFALVKEVYAQNELAIKIRGTHQKQLMAIIAEEIDTLNDTFSGIKVEKMIPCHCTSCINMATPHFFEYDSILDRIENRKETIECKNKPYENVSVMGLVDNLFGEFSAQFGRKRRSQRAPPQSETSTYTPEQETHLAKSWWKPWYLLSVVVGVVAFALAWWIFESAKSGVVFGFIIMIGMILINPERWLIRLAFASFSAFLGTLFFNWNIDYKSENLNIESTTVPVVLSLGLLLFSIVCIVAEHFRSKNK